MDWLHPGYGAGLLAGVGIVGVLVWALSGWRAQRSAREVRQWLQRELDPEHFQCVHNLKMRLSDGSTMQIDHVVVAPHGVFVLEVLHMPGSIWGQELETTWTQMVRHTRVSFQNPLRKNWLHAQALQHVLQVNAAQVHSLVVFTGASKFKNAMPHNVVQGRDCLQYMTRFLAPVWDGQKVYQLAEILRKPALHTRRVAKLRHGEPMRAPDAAPKTPVRPRHTVMVESKQMTKTETAAGVTCPPLAPAVMSGPRQCPICDSALIQLSLPQREGAPQYLLRCARWSHCEYTETVEDVALG